jgi:hypothetical protein
VADFSKKEKNRRKGKKLCPFYVDIKEGFSAIPFI